MITEKESTVLFNIPLFHEVPKLELYQLINELPIEDVKVGDYIFHEGDPGDSLYVVMTGQLEIVLAAGTENEMFLRHCGVGGYCRGNEPDHAEEGIRTASVRPSKDSGVGLKPQKSLTSVCSAGVIWRMPWWRY